MTDRLGEALTRMEGRMLDADEEATVAAARNWHTLINNRDDMIQKVAEAISDVTGLTWEHYQIEAASVVDALTVTADKETPDD